ncbi:DUF3888 domain-containing protein [Lihuaxuella thermophila]|uniref:DUF3888 domain-containing protein n=1 Tax=Lihuaxuella thermophila TaxID=1173111 RepID=A0A1H8E8V6_9BACL|nr:DUF3888 domain-containing protein [Lihuaxuella thermophila]SEN15287.1 Protein of unknown function [Lihuaxuella thermophila]
MKKIGFAVLIVCLFTLSLPGVAGAEPDESREKLITDAFKTTLIRAIDDAIVGYYGKREKSFGIYDMRVKDIQRTMQGGFAFLVKVQVETFEGPHNPPYGRETITLEVGPGGISVVKFEHDDIP